MDRYRSPEGAAAYRRKHRGSVIRRVADWRERALLARMLQRIAPVESVLDCPCGAGRFLPLLAQHASDVWAMDLAGEMVRLAREAPVRARLAVASADALPLPSRSVDAVVSCRFLHHFPRAEERAHMLAEAARVARKAVIVSFADADTWKGARSASRRRPITREQLRRDAAVANLTLEPPVLPVGPLFSSFSLACLRVNG